MAKNEAPSLTMDQVHEPVLPPDGTWKAQIISGKTKTIKSENPKAPEKKWLFTLKVFEAQEDVNAVELDARGDPADYSAVYYEIPFFDSRANWSLKKFALAANYSESDMTGLEPDDLAAALKGSEVLISGSEVYIEGYDEPKWEVSGYAAVE